MSVRVLAIGSYSAEPPISPVTLSSASITRLSLVKDNPNTDYALYLIDQEINYSRAVGNHVIVVIHGYGSHGAGGLIKNAVKEYLPRLKKNRIIREYVFGENWGDLNESKQLITSICPEVILHENLQGLNSGVSVKLTPKNYFSDSFLIN